MIWLQKLILLLPWVRRKREQILEEELTSYLDISAHNAEQSGLSSDDARFAAKRDLGNLRRAKEESRAQWSFPRWEQLLQDLRYAIRALRRTPTFTAVAILSLVLGIGAANSVFSLVDGIVLRPLAYRDPGRLIYLQEVVPALAHIYPKMPVNLNHFLYWRDHIHSFEAITALRASSFTLTGLGEPEQLSGVETSADLFRVLHTDTALGRGFLPGEDKPGKNNVVVITTNSLWQRRFQASPKIIGRSIALDSKPVTIVGVLRPDFTFPKNGDLGVLSRLDNRTEVFQPIGSYLDEWDGDYDYAVIGRLKPAVSMTQALSELRVLTAQMIRAHQVESQPRPVAEQLQDVIAGPVRTSLLVMLAAVLVLLLIVCLNLANLTLARANGRVREFSIRTALGADRHRLLQQLLTESFVLSFSGGALGAALSYFAIRLFVAKADIDIPRLQEVHISATVLLFSLVLTVVCACLFGLFPAYSVSKSNLQEAMRATGQAVTATRQSLRLRETLVGCEVALSTVLVFLAALLISSLTHLMNTDKGFHEEHAIALDLSLPGTQYKGSAARNRFFERALSQLSALPGVRSAGLISGLPLTGESQVNGIQLEGSDADWIDPSSKTPILINVRFVSPRYLETLGIPLLGGRTIQDQDQGRKVTVVSARLAAKVWPGQDPLGKKFKTGSNVDEVQVVGVVRDTYNDRLDGQPTLIAYVPYWIRTPTSASLVVRGTDEPNSLIHAMQRTIWSLDPSLPVSEVRTMSEIVSHSLARRRFQMRLATAFGLAALLLALIGLYGVVAYTVQQRRRELGLRLALGAQSGQLVTQMLRSGLQPVFIGLAAGLLVSLSLGHLFQGLVFGVTPTDPPTIAAAVSTLAATAFLACLLPARRVAQMDPAAILRQD